MHDRKKKNKLDTDLDVCMERKTERRENNEKKKDI